jgi:DNA-binding NtrC family response regulator
MDLDLQTKLLRFVQTSRFQPVGSTRTEQVDVRFVCATNRDPLAEVAAGRFREDLFYRLHVIPIHLPPLRERQQDILELAGRFLAQYAVEEGKRLACFDPEVENLLLGYNWPGNVRQLQNVIRNIVVLYDGERVTPPMLPPPLSRLASSSAASRCGTAAASWPRVEPTVGQSAGAEGPEGTEDSGMLTEPVIRPLKEIERDAIEQAIAHFDNNVPRAAAALGVSPSTIYRKRQTWSVEGV